jgi:hypothetical protein
VHLRIGAYASITRHFKPRHHSNLVSYDAHLQPNEDTHLQYMTVLQAYEAHLWPNKVHLQPYIIHPCQQKTETYQAIHCLFIYTAGQENKTEVIN